MIKWSDVGKVALGSFGLVGLNLANNWNNKDAATNAAKAQTQAAEKAADTYKQYNQPYYDVGTQNMQSLNQMVNSGAYTPNMQNWQQDPGYQFRLQEGGNAINANAAAGGQRFSSALMKAMVRYGQNFASNEYNNVYGRKSNELNNQYSRQAGLAQMGQNAATGLGNFLGENQYQIGNAQSAGIIGRQNANNQLMQNVNQGAMTIGGMLLGGPAGAAAASKAPSFGMGLYGNGQGQGQQLPYNYGQPLNQFYQNSGLV